MGQNDALVPYEAGEIIIPGADEQGGLLSFLDDESGDIDEYGDYEFGGLDDEEGDFDEEGAILVDEYGTPILDEYGRPRRRRRRRRRLPKLPRPRELARILRQAKAGDQKAKRLLAKAPPGVKAAMKVAGARTPTLAFFDVEGAELLSSDIGTHPKLEDWMIKAASASVGQNPPIAPSAAPGTLLNGVLTWTLNDLLVAAPYSIAQGEIVALPGFEIVIAGAPLYAVQGLPLTVIVYASATSTFTFNLLAKPGPKVTKMSFFVGRLQNGAVFPYNQKITIAANAAYPKITVSTVPSTYSGSLFFITPAHSAGRKLLSYM